MDVVVGFGPGVFPVGAGYTCLPFHVALGAGADGLVDGLVEESTVVEGALVGGVFEGVATADEGAEAEAESAGLVALGCAPLVVLEVDAGAPK